MSHERDRWAGPDAAGPNAAGPHAPGPESESGIELVVGRVGKPHGLRGEVRIDVRTDEPELRYAAGAVLAARTPQGAARDLIVDGTREHQGGLLVRFAGVEDRAAAEALRGMILHVTLAIDAVPEDPEEFYDHQLVGLAVEDGAGRPLGHITSVIHSSAQDLLTVRTPGGREALVPFVSALVPEVDLDGGHVVVADRPGLIAECAT